MKGFFRAKAIQISPPTPKIGPCGPGATMLAFKLATMLAHRADDGDKKAGHRGEHEVSRKTIARGMPGRSGVTVVTMLVCFFSFAREAAGASRARHSLRPLISGDAKFR